jgi:hypothetical protein
MGQSINPESLFTPSRPSKPSMCPNKARAYLREKLSQERLLALPTNRLGWEGLLGTNTQPITKISKLRL